MAGTISALGLGSGLQLQDILDQMRKIDEQPIDRLKEEKERVESQLTEFNKINQSLLEIKSKALTLSLSSTFMGRSISIGNEDVIAGSVSSGTQVGSRQITVNRLATVNSWRSEFGLSDKTTIINDSGVSQSLTLSIGDNDSFSITVPAGTTLQGLVSLINDDSNNPGITASIIDDGSSQAPYRLLLQASGTGESNRIRIQTQLDGYPLIDMQPVKSSWDGTEIDNPGSLISDDDDTFSYRVGNGDLITITGVDQKTIYQIADLINDDANNPGVTAQVVKNIEDSTYKLVLLSETEGEDGRITIENNLSGYLLVENQGANGSSLAPSLNAEIEVDGITYQRENNTSITDVLTGISLNLVGTGSTSLEIKTDTTELRQTIIDFVNGFNEVISQLKDDTGFDDDGNLKVLGDVTSASSLIYELVDLLSTQITMASSIKSMFDLGLSINRDGSITIDTSTLDSALNNNLNDVQEFFLGDDETGIEGFADHVNDRLRAITNVSTGIMATEKAAAQDRIRYLDQMIDSQMERLDRKYQILTQQFAQLDSFMNGMQSLSEYLTTQFDALSGKKD